MPETSEDRQRLLDAIPPDGAAIGNTTLMRRLGWTDERYWWVRDALIAEGAIERHRGRGGAVRRIVAAQVSTEEPVTAEAVAEVAADSYLREIQLYEPLRATLASDWAKDRVASPIAVEITAQQGRRQTGGRWSRPDIVAVEVKTYLYVPGKHLNVTTFEVKPSDTIDVSAVYEALAHRRSATHAYVVFHVPEENAAELEPVVEEVCRVARSHGVGVITVGDPLRYETWDEREEAVRFEPDPDRLDQFVVTQFSRRTADAVARALR
jgi:hypothetical protein